MMHRDALYGNIPIDSYLETSVLSDEIQRLKGIHLSSVPPTLISGAGQDANRFDHSIGTYHLIDILCKARPEFKDYEVALKFAALCHDAGSPPFTHYGEKALKEATGKNHEEYCKDILSGSPVESAMKACGYSLHEICGIINGKAGILGGMINNSIDADTLDNVYRYTLALVGNKEIEFNPKSLIKAFRISDGQVVLDRRYLKEIENWKLCREKMYECLIHTDGHIARSSMLSRAIGLTLEGKNEREISHFMHLKDNEALEYMKAESPDAKAILEPGESGNVYVPAARVSASEPSEKMKEICDGWAKSLLLADEIADELNAERKDISIEAFQHKSKRSIKKMLFPGKENTEDTPENIENIYDIKIFIHPKYSGNAQTRKLNTFLYNEGICGLQSTSQNP